MYCNLVCSVTRSAYVAQARFACQYHISVFFKENATDLSIYSAGLGGLMIAEMLDICPEELLPEIEDFFEVCDVDEISCGTLEVVKKDILAKEKPLRERKLINIYERNQKYYNSWFKGFE